MYQKWCALGEEKVAKMWLDQWEFARCSPVQMNQPNATPMRGGTPADNNGGEARNNGDKECLVRNAVWLLFWWTKWTRKFCVRSVQAILNTTEG
mmetsp:Transcript_5248/g.14752  ORF Transcript_5248/g.14752 Transcript_5248/m.14752 type:complete len:94 (+) Transcript_5248:118-399(+)